MYPQDHPLKTLPAVAVPADDSARLSSRKTFLTAAGWADAKLEPFAEDASFRRYFRLRRGSETLLLMDAPPPHERVAPFADIAEHLLSLGLSAPVIHARDDVDGWLLIEDFGDSTFTRLLADGHEEAPLYMRACEALIALHQHPDAAAVDVPSYSSDVLVNEANLLVDWHFRAVRGELLDDVARRAYEKAWRDVIAALPALPQTLVLRDYHVDNLMLLSARDSVRACGLLDFQDALIGSPAYDFASLVEDARRTVSAPLVTRLWDQYLAAFPQLDREVFAAWFRLLAAQRHAKVAGIFVRLRDRDGKDGYIRHIPRVVAYLAEHLCHPQLAPVADWFARYYPEFETRVGP